MKDITQKLVGILREGSCAPQIARIARKLKEPSTTIHYNIKKLEKEGMLRSCKAVFDHKKIGEGFSAYVLISLNPDEYGDPERIGSALAQHPEIESVDICTGGWEMVIKVHAKDMDAYYHFIRTVISRKGVAKTTTLASMRCVKGEFVLAAK